MLVALPLSPSEVHTNFLQELERGEFELPVLPAVAQDVRRLTQDPGADLSDLAALIQRDPSLAGHVLRAANSAALGSGQAITSLQQAVTRLGMQFIADAAFAVSVRGQLFNVRGFLAEAADAWRMAVASAEFGREIARLKRLNVEGQYLCGLLHNVGKPVALQRLSTLRSERGWRVDNGDLLQVADECHPTVGARLAVAWRLPRQVAVVCEWHRRPLEAPAFQEETAMAYLSHRLAGWMLAGGGGESGESELREDPVAEVLNFYPDDMSHLLARASAVASAVQALNV